MGNPDLKSSQSFFNMKSINCSSFSPSQHRWTEKLSQILKGLYSVIKSDPSYTKTIMSDAQRGILKTYIYIFLGDNFY